MSSRKLKMPEQEQYEYLTSQCRYLDDKIFQSFALFAQLATAIIGGTLFLWRTKEGASIPCIGWATNGLLCVVALGSIFLISNNLRSWKEHRDRLGECYDDVPEPEKRVWWASEALACVGIALVTAGFVLINPFGCEFNIAKLEPGDFRILLSLVFLGSSLITWLLPR